MDGTEASWLTQRARNRLLKRSVVLTHMDVYFESFWYIPCQGILHPATTYRLIEEDKLSPHLAAAVVSLTATVVSTYLPCNIPMADLAWTLTVP